MRVRRAGDGALLVDTGDSALAHHLRKHLMRLAPPGIVELVPGLSTLLIVADPLRADLDALAADIPTWNLEGETGEQPREHVIDVRYDGPDLDEVATLTGLTPEQIIERHSGAVYTAAFLGFAPGFAYLTGLDPALEVPRLQTPRTRVPTGAVAIAGRMTVVYPRPTPGGWRILGHADVRLFDPHKRPPAVFAPGDRIRFRRRS